MSTLPRRLRRPFFAAALLLAGGCAHATNLLDPATPRFEARYASPLLPAAASGAIRVVTFNIKFSKEVDLATQVLEGDSLRSADVVALQEMDEVAVDRIARALHLNYAYYPATIHPTTGRYFGPAVLSRWPIERSWKVLLPHASWIRGQRRTATAAILRIGGEPVLAYAVHLETPIRITPAEREDQVRAILRDAAGFPGPVVVAGDFNSEAIGSFLQREGFRWVTEGVGPTAAFFSWDHIFTRGMVAAGPGSTGVVRDIHGASDHRPVWALVTPIRPRSSPAVAAGAP